MNSLSLSINALPSSEEKGKLQIKHLKRLWYASLLNRSNKLTGQERQDEWPTDTALLAVLGLGLEQMMIYLYQETPSFEQLENWIIATAGTPDPSAVSRFNGLFSGHSRFSEEPPATFFDSDQIAFWKENGYIIIKNAVPREDCDAAIQVICDYIGIERDNPNTWYKHHPSRQGIMVQLFQHPVLQKNRESEVIRLAYEHLWQRKDIWLNTDRVGFNPPETSSWNFPGPNLHWDCKLEPPIPFGTQGILYLADTEANQGAFTLVPGFQHHVDDWIRTLPVNKQPHQMDLYALGPIPIVASAGDFIIWHKGLPHGSSPNRSAKPRFVQYINYQPGDFR